jgi:hypothetical protein
MGEHLHSHPLPGGDPAQNTLCLPVGLPGSAPQAIQTLRDQQTDRHT